MTARILLVDDETHLREAVSDLLQLEGYEVVSASDGEEALAKLQQGTFDLIIADIVMPRLDGWGLVSQVRADARLHDVPFVFLTARGQSADARQGRELGADDYLPKPFDPEDLLVLVRNRLRRREAVRGLYQDEVSRLQMLARVKDELLALTTHELARPLAAIKGFTELLLRGAHDGPHREFLQLIRQESQAMAQLADDLMQLAVLERGQALETEPLDTVALVREAMRPFHVPPHTHRFQLLAPAGLPLVQGDPALLRRAVVNLLANAVKYAPPRTPIRVALFRQGDRLCVEVTDEGIGIADADLARLGAPFFRVRSPATQGIAGTGLGFALVRRIVAAHRGQVHVTSRLGQGTRVALWLPIAAGDR